MYHHKNLLIKRKIRYEEKAAQHCWHRHVAAGMMLASTETGGRHGQQRAA